MNRPWEPGPEVLAAYFDGELSGPDCAAVAAWLADHPDARAEIECLRELQARYDTVPVPEPTPAAWGATLGRIEARLPRRRRRDWTWGLIGGIVAAAVVWVLLVRPVPQVDDEPFPVATAADVRILSMNPNDHGALVGVRGLELDGIELATHDDVEIVAGPEEGVMNVADWPTPMLVDPVVYLGPR